MVTVNILSYIIIFQDADVPTLYYFSFIKVIYFIDLKPGPDQSNITIFTLLAKIDYTTK